MIDSHHISLSALIIARNEREMLANCLDSLKWCSELIVIDNGSTDGTAELAEQHGARVIQFQSEDFSRLRNEALKRAKTEWVVYIDADERVTPQLAKEILVNCETETAQVFALKRSNVVYGHQINHGGWQSDVVERVFKRSALKEWTGKVHESPSYQGTVKQLASELWHFTHRSTTENLLKSAKWTKIEAELLASANIPPVTPFTLFRKFGMEVWRRAIWWNGRKDGAVGWIEALVQGLNKVMIYIQVWELQQKPSLEERYQSFDALVSEQWRQERSKS